MQMNKNIWLLKWCVSRITKDKILFDLDFFCAILQIPFCFSVEFLCPVLLSSFRYLLYGYTSSNFYETHKWRLRSPML